MIKMVNFLRYMAIRFFFINRYYWKFRSKRATENYWNNRDHPSNAFLHQLIEGIEFNTVLEIGSNCGNRLWGLGLKYPDAHFIGIDLNRHAIEFGNTQLRKAGIRNIELLHGEASHVRSILSGPADVVFSWATLMYIGPQEIEQVMRDLVLTANKALVLIEMHDDKLSLETNFRGILVPPRNWKRNYVRIVKKLGIMEKQIEIMDVPPDVWTPGGGHAKAILIERDQKCATR